MAVAAIEPATLTDLLREEHKGLRDMIRLFDTYTDPAWRANMAKEAVRRVAKHDLAEQALLYPNALRAEGVDRALVLRCKEAHHVAHVVLAELAVLPYDERYWAKFGELCTALERHMDEEELELFPQIERSRVDNLELGRRLRGMRETASSASKKALNVRAAIPGALIAGLLAVAALVVYRSLKDQRRVA